MSEIGNKVIEIAETIVSGKTPEETAKICNVPLEWTKSKVIMDCVKRLRRDK